MFVGHFLSLSSRLLMSIFLRSVTPMEGGSKKTKVFWRSSVVFPFFLEVLTPQRSPQKEMCFLYNWRRGRKRLILWLWRDCSLFLLPPRRHIVKKRERHVRPKEREWGGVGGGGMYLKGFYRFLQYLEGSYTSFFCFVGGVGCFLLSIIGVFVWTLLPR